MKRFYINKKQEKAFKNADSWVKNYFIYSETDNQQLKIINIDTNRLENFYDRIKVEKYGQ